MATLTTHAANALVDYTYRQQSYIPPANIYLAIGYHVAGVFTELTGNNYARQIVSFNVADNRGLIASADVVFPTASGDWAQADKFQLLDAVSGGNALCEGTLSTPVDINNGATLTVPAANIIVGLRRDISITWANTLLDFMFRGVAPTQPNAIYAGLNSTLQHADASGTEFSGNGYARVAVSFAAPTNGNITPASTVSFPEATPGPQGNARSFSFWDSLSGGTLLTYGRLSPALTIGAGKYLALEVANLEQRFY